MDSLKDFLKDYDINKVLHLTHDSADCDTVGSAYAASVTYGGTLGIYRTLKDSARNLLEELEAEFVVSPNIDDYDFVLLHDVSDIYLIGNKIPKNFGLIDHHKRGKRNEKLFENAKYIAHEIIDSTTIIMYKLLKKDNFEFSYKVLFALGCGFLTDSKMLEMASFDGFEIFLQIMDEGKYTLLDLEKIIYKTASEDIRKNLIENLKLIDYFTVEEYSVVKMKVYNHDEAFQLSEFFLKKGFDCLITYFEEGDVNIIRFFWSKKILEELNPLMIYEKISKDVNIADYWIGGIRSFENSEMLINKVVENIKEIKSKKN